MHHDLQVTKSFIKKKTKFSFKGSFLFFLGCFPILTNSDPPEWWYLVHALRNELSLAVDAGEGAVPRHLLECVRNVSWRRGAAVCRMGA